MVTTNGSRFAPAGLLQPVFPKVRADTVRPVLLGVCDPDLQHQHGLDLFKSAHFKC